MFNKKCLSAWAVTLWAVALFFSFLPTEASAQYVTVSSPNHYAVNLSGTNLPTNWGSPSPTGEFAVHGYVPAFSPYYWHVEFKWFWSARYVGEYYQYYGGSWHDLGAYHFPQSPAVLAGTGDYDYGVYSGDGTFSIDYTTFFSRGDVYNYYMANYPSRPPNSTPVAGDFYYLYTKAEWGWSVTVDMYYIDGGIRHDTSAGTAYNPNSMTCTDAGAFW